MADSRYDTESPIAWELPAMRPSRFTLRDRMDTLGQQSGELERAVSEKNPIRVFVTHLFEESDDYLRVFEFLESVERFFYLNVAKPENFPESGGPDAVKNELIEQIKQSEAIVVVADAFSREPDLVSYMMDVAEANDIGMIAIKPFGGIAETDRQVADRVQEHVEWNDRELVDAIRRQARGEDTARWEVVDFPGWDSDGEVKDQ